MVEALNTQVTYHSLPLMRWKIFDRDVSSIPSVLDFHVCVVVLLYVSEYSTYSVVKHTCTVQFTGKVT